MNPHDGSSIVTSLSTSAARCLGYGSFIALRHTGPLGTLFFASIGLDWKQILVVQALQIVSSGLFGMGLWALRNQGVVLPYRATSRCCIAAMGVCFALCFLAAHLGLGHWAIYILSCVMGAFAVYLMLQWLDVLVGVCRRHGRMRCTASILGCYLVAMVLSLPFVVMRAGSTVLLGATLIAGAISLASQESLVRSGAYRGLVKPTLTHPHDPNKPVIPTAKERRYRLTPYAMSLLASFGALYGITSGAVLMGRAAAQNYPTWVGIAATALVCFFSAAYYFNRSNAQDMHFGGFIRFTVVSSGIVLAAMPALTGVIPGVIGILCSFVLLILGIAMALFSVEICGETQADTLSITPLNYAFWTLAAGVGLTCVWAFVTLLDTHAALDYIALAAMVASLAVVPMLPSRSSSASTFTLAQLPENEDSSSRAARSRDAFVARHNLTVREAEVFDLLLAGKTRSEIASQLLLSSWTVKGYIANIYEKTGVHSAKELMSLVNIGE